MIEKLAAGVLVWFMRRRLERKGHDPQKAEGFLKRAICDVEAAAEDALVWNKTEIANLTPRLERRFDVGMAMNEAAQRAMQAKRENGTDREVQELSGTQKAALTFQQEYLQKLVDRA